MRRIYAPLFALLALAACAEGPPVSSPPDMTFANLRPFEINAAKVEVINNYRPPLQAPNVDHAFRTPPAVATEQLIKKQLLPVGHENVLRAIIDDASVVSEEIEQPDGFVNALMDREDARLKGKILVRFELVSPLAPDVVLGHAQVLAKREKTLVDGVSLAERQRVYHSLTEDLMDNLNDGMRAIVVSTFGVKP
jgi:hypothetical protein